MPKALSLLVLGVAVTAVGFVLAALVYIGYVFDINLFSILFDVGLVAAIVLAYFAWLEYQAGAQGPPGARRSSRPGVRRRLRHPRHRRQPPAGES